MNVCSFASFADMRIRRDGRAGYGWVREFARNQQVSNHPDVRPTLDRLEWLFEQNLGKHSFEAMFLIGSLSWGRFCSVCSREDHNSDVDLLIVLKSLNDESNERKLELFNSTANLVYSEMRELVAGNRVDVIAFESLIPDRHFTLSCTLIEERAFVAMLEGKLNEVVALRNKRIDVDSEIRRHHHAGELYRPVLTKKLGNGYFLVTSSLYRPFSGIGVPAYIELLLPHLEYFGFLPSHIEKLVKKLAREIGNKLHGASDLNQFAHYRYNRMSQTSKKRLGDHLMAGPYRLD